MNAIREIVFVAFSHRMNRFKGTLSDEMDQAKSGLI
jgi:hypothetical protein